MAELEIRSPVTGDVLGTVAERDAGAAVEAARLVQPLWAAVPAVARAHYLRRAAQAVLDELDRLALLIARCCLRSAPCTRLPTTVRARSPTSGSDGRRCCAPGGARCSCRRRPASSASAGAAPRRGRSR